MQANPTIVPLTPEQLKSSRQELREIQAIDDVLAELVERLAERRVERESMFWEQMHEICGTSDETHKLNIQWIAGTIKATPYDKRTTSNAS